MSAPTTKLTYFNITGRAEYIRYLLYYGGIDFVDERLTREQFQVRKSTFPFGKVPVLEIDGMTIYQSVVICRYLGSKFGLVPKNMKEALQCEILGDTINDLRGLLRDYYTETRPEAKEQKKITNISEGRYCLEKLNHIVQNNGGHFISRQLTWTDFLFAAQADRYNVYLGQDVIADYSALRDLKNKVQMLPAVKRYLETAPTPLF